MMLSHRLLVAGMMLAPQSKCSVPGSFENETLLICIITIQEKVHQSIPKADTGLPWMYVVLKFLSCLQFQYQTARCGNIYYQERAFGIFKLCTTIQYKSRPPLHSMPSNWGREKSASWRRVEIIKAFAFIRVKDSLPRIWPVTSPFSSPLHLARALASNLTWVTAPC